MSVDIGSTVIIKVDIASAEWAGIDAVDFYINNQPERTSAANEAARYGVCTDIAMKSGDAGWTETLVVVNDGIPGASRSEISVSLELEVTEDTWVVAVAHGSDGVSSPLFPIVPEDLDPSTNETLADLIDDNLDEGGVLAYAFTNPIFFDVGGDGWSPAGVANAPCSP